MNETFYLIEYYDNFSLVKTNKSEIEYRKEWPRYTIHKKADSLGNMIRQIQDMKERRVRMSPNQSLYLNHLLEKHPEYVL
jgi:hypothetical protein